MQSPTPDPAEQPQFSAAQPGPDATGVAPEAAARPADATQDGVPAPLAGTPVAHHGAPSQAADVPVAHYGAPSQAADVPVAHETASADAQPAGVPATAEATAHHGTSAQPTGTFASAEAPAEAAAPTAPGAVEAAPQHAPVPHPFGPPPITGTQRGPRPATVTTALVLQYVVAGLLLVAGALVLWEGIGYNALINDAASVAGASQTDAAAERLMNWSGTGVAVSLIVLLAGWLLTNTLLMARGANVARILNLVGLGAPIGMAVLALCGSGVAASFATVSLGGSEDPLGSDPWAEQPFPEDFEGGLPSPDSYYHADAFNARLTDLLEERNTAVFDVGLPLVAIITVFLAVAVFVLLVVPASNRWFSPGGDRPRPRRFTPPPAFAGYGAHPAHPFPPQPHQHVPVPHQQPFAAPHQPFSPPHQQQFPVPPQPFPAPHEQHQAPPPQFQAPHQPFPAPYEHQAPPQPGRPDPSQPHPAQPYPPQQPPPGTGPQQ
ncbi:hypothetical protein [Catenuloplanes japonicus]|uniref:hypothetical protein n=1 Tax=Catenuloplanes japonicus TaxID=33876 RepID=UPI000525E08E|nr:hypothetical protein [Catenuloplanes japonicus]